MKRAFAASVFLFASAVLSAHPLNEVEIRTDSRFTIMKKSIRFEIKFPAHDFYDARGGMPENGLRAAVEAYLKEHLSAFDGRVPLAMRLESAGTGSAALSADGTPRFIVAAGTFQGAAPLRDVYLFNEMFKEGPVPHVGAAVIEWRGKTYDFHFKPKTYFRLEVGK